jgi:AcrR family transcriptional regulator
LSTTILRYVATPTEAGRALRPEPRQRILDTAYELFSHRGVRDVGVNELIEQADVAKATFYRHFASKDALVLAFLGEREQRWAYGWVVATVQERGGTPEEQLLAIFDLFDEWFATDDFEGCSIINVQLEIGDHAHPISQECTAAFVRLRTVLSTLAEAAGLRDPDEFALSWHLLMKGSIVQAAEGDVGAARRAQTVGRLLIEHHRIGPSPVNV